MGWSVPASCAHRGTSHKAVVPKESRFLSNQTPTAGPAATDGSIPYSINNETSGWTLHAGRSTSGGAVDESPSGIGGWLVAVTSFGDPWGRIVTGIGRRGSAWLGVSRRDFDPRESVAAELTSVLAVGCVSTGPGVGTGGAARAASPGAVPLEPDVAGSLLEGAEPAGGGASSVSFGSEGFGSSARASTRDTVSTKESQELETRTRLPPSRTNSDS